MRPNGRASEDITALRDLLDRAARDDAPPAVQAEARAALDALFAAEQDRIYHVCLRFTGDAERARELAQETFLTAYRKLAEFRGDSSFYSWLYGIARFKCLRAREKKQDLLSDDGVLEPEDGSHGVMRMLRRQERDRLLMSAAAAVLTAEEQEAVYLRYVENLGIPRITELLEITDPSGARGVLQRCKRKLGREIARQLEELGHGQSLLFGSIA